MTKTNLPTGPPRRMDRHRRAKLTRNEALDESEETPLDVIYANWFGFFNLRRDKVYVVRGTQGRTRGKLVHYERGDPLFLSRPGDFKEFADIESEYNKLRLRYEKLCSELEVVDSTNYAKIWDRTRFIKWWRRAKNIQSMVRKTGLTPDGLYTRAKELRNKGYHMPQLERTNARKQTK